MGVEEIVVYAVVFAGLFVFGGIVAALELPNIPGIFFIGGMLVGIFGTGAGTFILSLVSKY